jgi:hypothetical protein
MNIMLFVPVSKRFTVEIDGMREKSGFASQTTGIGVFLPDHRK